MATFIKMNPKLANGWNINKNIKGEQKEEGQWLNTLQERKQKKYHFASDHVQRIFDELMATKTISF